MRLKSNVFMVSLFVLALFVVVDVYATQTTNYNGYGMQKQDTTVCTLDDDGYLVMKYSSGAGVKYSCKLYRSLDLTEGDTLDQVEVIFVVENTNNCSATATIFRRGVYAGVKNPKRVVGTKDTITDGVNKLLLLGTSMVANAKKAYWIEIDMTTTNDVPEFGEDGYDSTAPAAPEYVCIFKGIRVTTQ